MSIPIRKGYKLVHIERLGLTAIDSQDYQVPSGALCVRADTCFYVFVKDAPKVEVPEGATHKWSASGQFAKRCGGNTWAIWQDHEWLWIGDEFKGAMIHLLAERDNAIADMCEVTGEHITVRSAEALYDAGYRKFEIVEGDV